MKILLIEDDPDDIELLQDALHKYGVTNQMEVIKDGAKAADYFRSSTHIPDIIILDLNLPKVHGRELILEIKSSPSFKNIPLVILTTSSAKEDVEYSYRNGADKYLFKPGNLQQIKHNVEMIASVAHKSLAGK